MCTMNACVYVRIIAWCGTFKCVLLCFMVLSSLFILNMHVYMCICTRYRLAKQRFVPVFEESSFREGELDSYFAASNSGELLQYTSVTMKCMFICSKKPNFSYQLRTVDLHNSASSII